MKIEQIDNYIRVENDKQIFIITKDNLTISNKNKSLKELKQKLINDLYNKSNCSYNENDVEILKMLFKYGN